MGQIVSPKIHALKWQPLVSQNVTVVEGRVFNEVISL
jgi:hypothetical protein